MSNPLDPIVATLRSAEPRPEAVQRAVVALRRSHPPRLVPLAAGVTALSAALLWPREGSGVAWAQVAALGPPVRYILRESLVRGGRRIPWSTFWRDGAARSTKMQVDLPTGGKLIFLSTPQVRYSRLGNHATVSRAKAATTPPKESPSLWTPFSAQPIELEKLLGDKEIRQVGVDHAFASRVGKADRYRLDRFAFDYGHDKAGKRTYREYRQRFDVFVEPSSRKVLGWDVLGPGSMQGAQYTVEYPERIEPATFTIPKDDVPVYDVDAGLAKVRETLLKPLGTARLGGVETRLRLVLQDRYKTLWTFWTGGAPPNGDLAHPVRVVGERSLRVEGLGVFTAQGERGYRSPFSGHAIRLGRTLDTVDLEVPVFAPGPIRSRYVGKTTFRNVRVLPIDMVYTAYNELKMDRKPR